MLSLATAACSGADSDELESEETGPRDVDAGIDGGHADAAARAQSQDAGTDAALPTLPAVTVLSNVQPAQVPAAPGFDLRISQQCTFDSEEGRLRVSAASRTTTVNSGLPWSSRQRVSLWRHQRALVAGRHGRRGLRPR